jgi:hypothetical protein
MSDKSTYDWSAFYTTSEKLKRLDIEIKDISTAETVIWPIGCLGGMVVAYMITYDVAITVADAEITANISGGDDFMTQAIDTDDDAGTIKKGFVTENNTFTIADNLQVSTNGLSTTASRCTVSFFIMPDL